MKLTLLDSREDTNKKKNGAPIHYGDLATFYVKRAACDRYRKEMQEIYKSQYGFNYSESDIKHDACVAIWLARYGVTGWEGVYQDDIAVTEGKQIPYSQSVAEQIFLNPEYFNSLNQHLHNAACNFNNYLVEEALEAMEEIKKP